MIYAFWTILIIVVVLRLYWKHSAPSRAIVKQTPTVSGNKGFETPITEQAIKENKKLKAEREAREAQRIVDKQRERDIAELRKQGYTDELIAVIIPTINNGE